MPSSEIPILYRDEHLVVIDKPAWSVVHRTRGAKGALVLTSALIKQLGQRVWPVHRLDRQTSGVMAFALSQKAASFLGEHCREGHWRKSYLGLCRGFIERAERVERPVPEGDHRRPARTLIAPLELFCDRYTLVRATPWTGRRHQIRYHVKHLRCPLVGDKNYGDGKVNRLFREAFGMNRMFLHAERLKLAHPVENHMLELKVGLPAELEAVLEKLRVYEGPVA